MDCISVNLFRERLLPLYEGNKGALDRLGVFFTIRTGAWVGSSQKPRYAKQQIVKEPSGSALCWNSPLHMHGPRRTLRFWHETRAS